MVLLQTIFLVVLLSKGWRPSSFNRVTPNQRRSRFKAPCTISCCATSPLLLAGFLSIRTLRNPVRQPNYAMKNRFLHSLLPKKSVLELKFRPRAPSSLWAQRSGAFAFSSRYYPRCSFFGGARVGWGFRHRGVRILKNSASTSSSSSDGDNNQQNATGDAPTERKGR
ncbi:hypothetical protein FN846DRAFT_733293 [Sphaerosporella brunnea]|uniref:Secreted protein n=1 Tax=Sphaerosporella brunnea TaxID=1250544 RepID=A0A5J5EW73_9PEZI|nr:hypothetical protein FN846DRAFT_733293 [Sphaerosporella brunnea]